MAKKKKQLDKVTLVKEMSREQIGQVKTERTIPDKRKKALKKITERETREQINERCS